MEMQRLGLDPSFYFRRLLEYSWGQRRFVLVATTLSER